MARHTPLRGDKPPTFFLAATPDEGAARLIDGEAEHALRVLRVRAGDRLDAIDGRGRRWTLEVEHAGRNELALKPLGPPVATPAPGEEGAALPWIEVAVAWPKKSRGEEMLGRLVQLGAAAITPLESRRGAPGAVPEATPERWLRIAREACKQCGRSWMPLFHPPATVDAWLEERAGEGVAVLDPARGMAFDTWLRSLQPALGGLGTRERPIAIAVGPEGGFDDEEEAAFLEAGCSPVRLGPHVLRIETAAEAGLAVAATVLRSSLV